MPERSLLLSTFQTVSAKSRGSSQNSTSGGLGIHPLGPVGPVTLEPFDRGEPFSLAGPHLVGEPRPPSGTG